MNQQICQNSRYPARCDAGCEDVPQRFRQLAQYFGNQLHTEAERETDSHDKGSLPIDFLRCNDADACRRHRTEHQQSSAAQYGFGHQ